jgi:capsular polysaccharide biosynthesis protein
MMRLLLLRFLETYFRHRWLYLLPIALMLAGFAAFLVTARPSYPARGTLYVERQTLLASIATNQQDNIGFATPAQVTVDEFRELMQTDAFVRAIIKPTALEANMNQGVSAQDTLFTDLRKWVWATPVGNNIVEINAMHEKAEVAQQLANTAIQVYLDWRINNDQQESLVAQSFFSSLIDQYTGEVDKARANLQAYLEAHPDPVRGERSTLEKMQIDKLQAAIDDTQNRLQKTQEKEENSRLALKQAEHNVRQKYLVIDQPALPDKNDMSRKRLLISGAIFLVVGLLLATIGVVGGTLLDQSFHYPLDVTYGLALPVLALVPPAQPHLRRSSRADKKAKQKRGDLPSKTPSAQPAANQPAQ